MSQTGSGLGDDDHDVVDGDDAVGCEDDVAAVEDGVDPWISVEIAQDKFVYLEGQEKSCFKHKCLLLLLTALITCPYPLDLEFFQKIVSGTFLLHCPKKEHVVVL